jgi:O-methyltransferase
LESDASQPAGLRIRTGLTNSSSLKLPAAFPRLSVGGVLIIHEYGVWRGSRQAVDQYIAEKNLKVLLTRLDQGARLAIKL